MPTQKPFSRKTATRYALVNRPQNDPLIHDTNAPSQVFTGISGPAVREGASTGGAHKIKQRGDLEDEFGLSGEALPVNEEVAAEHGVRFNDTYDYLQHLRDLGQGSGYAAWIEARSEEKYKDKGKQKLEDALREVRLDDAQDDLRSEGGMSSFSMSSTRDRPGWQRYQEQQNIPDDIAGFQPDMDPRLREVLDALDDEAYVDDDNEIFDELVGEGGEELDLDVWEETGFQDDDDDGWESDDTVKAVDATEARQADLSDIEHQDRSQDAEAGAGDTAPPTDEHGDGAFLEDMAKAKAAGQDQRPPLKATAHQTPSIAPSGAQSGLTSINGRRKKRKGALTSSTGFSMTSSALARTEAMSTLDSRFDKLLDSYMDDIPEDEDDVLDDNASAVTGMSNMTGASRMSFASRSEADSEAPSLASNAAFSRAMDEFMVTSGKKGKKMKKGGKQGVWGQESGISQLDDIRKGLGPARIRAG